MSIISLAELYGGVERARDRDAAEEAVTSFLSQVEILTVGEETCREFGKLSALLRTNNIHPGDFDVLIASTAMEHGLTVLTTDGDDFQRFPGVRLIIKP